MFQLICDKHVDLQFHFTKYMVHRNVIKINYLQTEDMPADIFTKGLPSDRQIFLKAKIGVL